MISKFYNIAHPQIDDKAFLFLSDIIKATPTFYFSSTLIIK